MMVYTLAPNILNSQPYEFFLPTEKKTSSIFQRFGGAYYVVSQIPNNQSISVEFSRLVATTDLTDYDKTAIGNITSLFTATDTQTYSLKNNDMLILSIGLVPSGTIEGGIDIALQWTQIEFRVPIGGITTLNIQDYAVSNLKIGNDAISDRNIQSGAIIGSKIADESIATRHLQNLCVTNSKLADNAVGSRNLINASITTTKIADNAITASKIQNSTISITKCFSFTNSVIFKYN
jgi:hypothetical protein